MRLKPTNRAALSTVVAIIAVSGLAFTLVGIVIARSPYTHGNLSPEGYDRTEIAIVGEEYPFEGLGLADAFTPTGDPVADGQLLFFQYGCKSCHGSGTGAIVGDDLDDVSPSEVRREVRDGPEGMPAYSSSLLSDEDLELIVAFLKSDIGVSSETAGDGHTSPPLISGEGEYVRGGSVLERIGIVLATTLDRVTARQTSATKGTSR